MSGAENVGLVLLLVGVGLAMIWIYLLGQKVGQMEGRRQADAFGCLKCRRRAARLQKIGRKEAE